MHRLQKIMKYVICRPRSVPKLLFMDYLRREEERREELRRNASFFNATRDFIARILSIALSLFLWSNGVTSLAAFATFTSLYWLLILFRAHGLTAASSAALTTVFTYICIESHDSYKTSTENLIKNNSRTFGVLYQKTKYVFDSILCLQREQPRTFCTAASTVILGYWLIGRKLETALIVYLTCMCIFVGPEVLMRITVLHKPPLSSKECDSEIEEFLPAVTEDNLDILKRAGDTGDRSPTPPNRDMDSTQDQLVDEDLQGMKMPSHEEGSTDGLELSELELSASETDIDGIRFQSGHFERGSSSSDDDAEIGLEAKTLDDDNDDTDDDSDFEIIDSSELANFKNV